MLMEIELFLLFLSYETYDPEGSKPLAKIGNFGRSNQKCFRLHRLIKKLRSFWSQNIGWKGPRISEKHVHAWFWHDWLRTFFFTFFFRMPWCPRILAISVRCPIVIFVSIIPDHFLPPWVLVTVAMHSPAPWELN